MNLPNRITVFRLLLVPVFTVLLLIEFPFHNLIAAIVFVVASLSDFLDGYLARKLHLVTNIGKFLDPLADKTLVCTALVLVCVYDNPFKLVILIATIIIIIRELLITGFRTVAASKNVILAADKWGKIKTALQMIGLAFYIAYPSFAGVVGNVFMYGGIIALGLATIFAVISAVNYLVKNRAVFSDAPNGNDFAKQIIENANGTIAVAESFTGGGVCSKLVGVAGASKYLVKGVVCYSNASKINDLGVPTEIIERFGAVSSQTAEYMVKGVMRSCKSDYAVATTGNAGPTAEKEGETGVCFIAVADKNSCNVTRYEFTGQRGDVISKGIDAALEQLLSTIKKSH